MNDDQSYIDHSFVIPAYGESPYLEQCIQSLRAQSVRSRIILATSTDNALIRALGAQYHIDVMVNANGGSIAKDWSFAYACATTTYVTLAHQDDVYDVHYSERCMQLANAHPSSIIIFTDYNEIFKGRIRSRNLILLVKRFILFCFFAFGSTLRSSFMKRYVLAFGSPISCPTVCFNRSHIGALEFNDGFSVNIDWDAWRRLAQLDGAFVYSRHVGLSHRIYAESQTSIGLQNMKRQQEDRQMFGEFWPKPVARVLSALYSLSYQSNKT